MFDINHYVNISKIGQAVKDLQNISFDQMQNQGILNLGFSPFTQLLGSWFWGLTFGIIAIALYSWSEDKYVLIGYLIAITVVTGIIIPASLGDFFSVILGFAVAGLLYFALVKKKGAKKVVREND